MSTHIRDPCPALGGLYWHVPRYVCFHSGPAIEEHDNAHHRRRDQKLSIDTKPGKVETYLLAKVLPKGYTQNIGSVRCLRQSIKYWSTSEVPKLFNYKVPCANSQFSIIYNYELEMKICIKKLMFFPILSWHVRPNLCHRPWFGHLWSKAMCQSDLRVTW